MRLHAGPRTLRSMEKTETEHLLELAADIARRSFEYPSERTVRVVFVRLCAEAAQWGDAGTPARPDRTLH